MLKPLDVLKQARDLGSTKTLADVTAAINAVKRAEKETAHKARYQVEIWDKVSPINGVDAETVKERHNVTDGEVYLVYIDGNLTYLQPHDPDQIGFAKMDKNGALAKAEAHIGRIVEETVDAEVLEEVLTQLL